MGGISYGHAARQQTSTSIGTFHACICLQVPDEKDLLKRRIRAEQRKQRALTLLDGSNESPAVAPGKSGKSLVSGTVGCTKAITLVVR